MEHEYWEVQLQGYVDKELSPADMKAMEAHIDQCADCAANLEYMTSLKSRLRQHREMVEIPASVKTRIDDLFEKKRKPLWRKVVNPAFGVALAAVLVAGILLNPFSQSAVYAFSEGTVVGTITCPDCHIADKSGLEKGTLCHDGHGLGLICKDTGEVYRIAMDTKGMDLKSQRGAYYGKDVTVTGMILQHERIIRVTDLAETVPTQASLNRTSRF